jgi:hypothetical protein
LLKKKETPWVVFSGEEDISGDYSGHRSSQKHHQIKQIIHGFVRFFTRISNMQLVFNESLQKGKNEANKVSESKHKLTIQYKLEQNS